MLFIRSILFNALFFLVTGICCIAFLPGLLLPRKKMLRIVRVWLNMVYWLERHILGLTWSVRGMEHLPTSGSYLVAAKHQSAYETFKIHLLFHDPAVVLKKELLKIPIWGKFVHKAGGIPIDRKSRESAVKSIVDGAIAASGESRPIIIFPQGTRVKPQQTPADKPYRAGVARMQHASDLPIIPMALNSGTYYPKGSWLRYSGEIVFEFLPPIQPGSTIEETMKTLEDALEKASNLLTKEARTSLQSSSATKEIVT